MRAEGRQAGYPHPASAHSQEGRCIAGSRHLRAVGDQVRQVTLVERLAVALAGPAARQAAASMVRLRLSHADPAVVRCLPPADGSAEVLVFAYPGRPDVDLFMLNGCGGVSNGYISAGSGYY